MDEKSKLSTVLLWLLGRGGGLGVIGTINGTNINSLPKLPMVLSDLMILLDGIKEEMLPILVQITKHQV